MTDPRVPIHTAFNTGRHEPMTPNEYTELQEIKEVTCGSLSVVVDFNDLYADKADEVWDILGRLKDLLT